jgi:hypothetical protein
MMLKCMAWCYCWPVRKSEPETPVSELINQSQYADNLRQLKESEYLWNHQLTELEGRDASKWLIDTDLEPDRENIHTLASLQGDKHMFSARDTHDTPRSDLCSFPARTLTSADRGDG